MMEEDERTIAKQFCDILNADCRCEGCGCWGMPNDVKKRDEVYGTRCADCYTRAVQNKE